MMRPQVILLAPVAVTLIVLGIWVAPRYGTRPQSFPEASEIARGARDFKELSERFTQLAENKGALYAYEVLRRADLPPNTDVHLLGHVVGDQLYKQKGVQAIEHCTQEFRNACSHTIVIGALGEYGGDEALGMIRSACEKAPGGSGAYTMCFHGLGHGVFAYFGYDLADTVDYCAKTVTETHAHREYAECVGGAVMELMGGGGHDRDAWLKSRERYLVDSDPLAPCSTSVIPRDAKSDCYMYITPHLFEVAGADLSRPEPKHFAAAFLYCDRIPGDLPDLRAACFAGIGKEFPVLALSRDIRAIEGATDEQLATMRAWCSLAPHDEAYKECTRSIVGSLYWGGENNPQETIRFCQQALGAERDDCYVDLLENARRYPAVRYPGTSLCALFPTDKKDACIAGIRS